VILMNEMHKDNVVYWLNGMIQYEGSCTTKEITFFKTFKATILSGAFNISNHLLGDSELIPEKVYQWLQRYENEHNAENEDYDPALEEALEAVHLQHEFGNFERDIVKGTCERCDQSGRDLDMLDGISLGHMSGKQIYHVCHYGCHDPRSIVPENYDYSENGGDNDYDQL